MPNWCFSSVVIEGDKREIDVLECMLNRLSQMEEPAVKNDFGPNWLGCIIDKLGGDCQEVRCRGTWSDLHRVSDTTICLETETAWAPCCETFNFICRQFPSMRYYYSSEEPSMGEFWTNDKEGKYFPCRYYVELCTPDELFGCEYFKTLDEALLWIREGYAKEVKTRQDVELLCERWEEESPDAYCCLHEFQTDEG